MGLFSDFGEHRFNYLFQRTDFSAHDPMKGAQIHTLIQGSNMRFVMKLRVEGIRPSTMVNPNP